MVTLHPIRVDEKDWKENKDGSDGECSTNSQGTRKGR